MRKVFRFFTFEVLTSEGEREHITVRTYSLSDAEAALEKAVKVRGYEVEAVKRLRKVRHAVAV